MLTGKVGGEDEGESDGEGYPQLQTEPFSPPSNSHPDPKSGLFPYLGVCFREKLVPFRGDLFVYLENG